MSVNNLFTGGTMEKQKNKKWWRKKVEDGGSWQPPPPPKPKSKVVTDFRSIFVVPEQTSNKKKPRGN